VHERLEHYAATLGRVGHVHTLTQTRGVWKACRQKAPFRDRPNGGPRHGSGSPDHDLAYVWFGVARPHGQVCGTETSGPHCMAQPCNVCTCTLCVHTYPHASHPCAALVALHYSCMLTYHGSLVQAYMCSIVPATVATAGTGAPSGALHLRCTPEENIGRASIELLGDRLCRCR